VLSATLKSVAFNKDPTVGIVIFEANVVSSQADSANVVKLFLIYYTLFGIGFSPTFATLVLKAVAKVEFAVEFCPSLFK
jgi:hypothetical protein